MASENISTVETPYDILERIFHWMHTCNLVLLLLTGITIHSGNYNFFGDMGNSRVIHFFNGWIFLFLGIWHVYRFFGTGKYVESFPSPKKRWDNLKKTIRYYLFLEDELETLGEGGKDYNELQKLGYLGLFIISGIQVVLGLSLYNPETMAPVVSILGGLQWVRYFHHVTAWIYLFFTCMHLYLVFSHGMRLLNRMKLK